MLAWSERSGSLKPNTTPDDEEVVLAFRMLLREVWAEASDRMLTAFHCMGTKEREELLGEGWGDQLSGWLFYVNN